MIRIQKNMLPQKKPPRIHRRFRITNPEGLAIRESRNTQRTADSPSSRHLRIPEDRAAFPQRMTQIGRGRNRIGMFALGLQAVLTGIWSRERRVGLNDPGELKMGAPSGIFE